MNDPNVQDCPVNPSQTTPTGFNLQYFFTQWATLAQVINNHAQRIKDLYAKISGITPTTPTLSVVVTDVTGTRLLDGTVYQNTSLGRMDVVGAAKIVGGGGSGDSTLKCYIGPTNPPTQYITGDTMEATVAGEPLAINFPVPPSYFWKIVITNILSNTPDTLVEVVTTIT